eukprot:m.2613 g.2613  ORF g.2613 m.2613 type:complete len:78 (-) comp1457_c0_seq1:72-305(-)
MARGALEVLPTSPSAANAASSRTRLTQQGATFNLRKFDLIKAQVFLVILFANSRALLALPGLTCAETGSQLTANGGF